MGNRPKLLLIYPRLGTVASYIRSVPLSLIYVATRVQKLPIDIEILDLRIEKSWEDLLERKLTSEPILAVGVSVMSGITILNALAASGIVKNHSQAPVIWGGPHPTILPEEVLRCPEVDFVVRGFGSDALAQLIDRLLNKSPHFDDIPGLCYKRDGKAVITPINCTYEMFDFRELPYNLIEHKLDSYFTGMDVKMLPIYSSLGCPYQCAFCIAPIWYKGNEKRWVPLEPGQVVDHIEWLQKQYGIDYIYFYDDDSFVDPAHFMSITREILKRGLKIKIGFRGFRVNELVRLKDEDLSLLNRAGIKSIHIGAESGSARMLKLMKKGITVEQTLQANRMLAQQPGMIPIYNLLVGLPTERLDDLRETRDLMLRLIEENPHAIIWVPCKLIPYPGSELYDLVLRHGFNPPDDIRGWSCLDQELEMRFPWIPPENERYIRMLQVTSYFIDNKSAYLGNLKFLSRCGFRLVRFLYRPLALWRLRNDRCGVLIEYPILNMLKKLMGG
ncbi:MAG: radical SAM protein [Candidatus Aureabacteria bacterium]|nr:radical SAM protein [Candidatus Auribacterota bacterium]